MDKVYFIKYIDDGINIIAYDGITKVIDIIEEKYNEQGYLNCLADFGFKYYGSIDEISKYLKSLQGVYYG